MKSYRPFLFLATLSTASDDDEDTEKNKTPTKSSTKSESFERHNFPRDSGCFASSSPASDRSSQQSQSESGIHLPHDDDEDADYSDESTSLGKLNNKLKIQFKKILSKCFDWCIFLHHKVLFYHIMKFAFDLQAKKNPKKILNKGVCTNHVGK